MKKEHKLKGDTLFKILKLVYGLFPLEAISRDILFVIIIALEMYGITLGGLFIDAIADFITNTQTFTFDGFFYSNAFYYTALSLGVWMLVSSLNSLRNYLYDILAQKVKFHMQSARLEVIARSNLEDVERKDFRDLLEFIPTFSYENILAAYAGFSDAIKWSVRGVASIGFLFSTLGWSALLLILFAIPENIVAHYNRRKRHKYNSSEVERLKKVSYLETIITRLPYFPELRVDNAIKYLKNTYSTEGGKYMGGILELTKHFYIDTTLFTQLGRLFLVGYVVYILVVSVTLKLTIGHFKALYDYAVTAYESFNSLVSTLLKMYTFLDYSEPYFKFTEYKGFGDVKNGEHIIDGDTPALELKDLTYIHKDSGKRALNDITLKIPAGSNIAIVGSDGSGKSTFVRILCGLYQIVDGDYIIGGKSIKELARGELKKRISVVFQEFVNYNLSLKENITLTAEEKRVKTKLYEKILKISGVKEMMEKEGLTDSQILGKYFSKGREISPGYWQRLAIARALYRNRDIYIMDEPFLYIDEKSRGKILRDVMNHLGSGRTLIYVTQEEDFLDLFDQVYDLRNGKLYPREKK
ncbi:MAG TPA: ABC transporter ATP-binding protein [Candidatus Dojkabacteria bacterium]|nr:ABC transporter ATP-binding protein [Candidatus Dojkabacteria bacterium]